MCPTLQNSSHPPADSLVMHPIDRDAMRASERVKALNIPDHKIIRCIGYGSYGEVWLAQSITGTYRAIKTIWRDDFSDDASFKREYEGLLFYEPIARSHLGLVHILHIGQQQGETPMYYYVMELADDALTGAIIEPERYTPRSLLNDIKRYNNSPMPIDIVINVGCQLARALRYLHEQDLTHRDIKPANIIFVRERAKLADAGLIVQGAKQGYAGTPGYVPPDGAGTPRADVYALAMVLYEMISGRDRMDFPDLPDEIPDIDQREKWLALNQTICLAASPQVTSESITTADALLLQLEQIRMGVYKKQSPLKQWIKELKLRRLFLYALPIILLLLAFQHLPSDFRERIEKAYILLTNPNSELSLPMPTGKKQLVNETLTSSASNDGQLYVISTPTSASVYKLNGEYINETPFGPIILPAGTSVRLVLRKEGYADMTVEGEIKPREVLSLGGDLYPLDLPQVGHKWRDALGNAYESQGKQHLSKEPIIRKNFDRFIKDTSFIDQKSFSTFLDEQTHAEIVLTDISIANLYSEWLMKQCEKQGLIDESFIILPKQDDSISPVDNHHAYRIAVAQLPHTPITIFTNPAGASVMLNGKYLGVTPVVNLSVPHAPYHLELRLQRHKTIYHSGFSPENMRLNFQLEPTNAVSFNAAWFNSLGLNFIPLGNNIMAGATEVRIRDYEQYCEDTGSTIPVKPAYPFNEHSPAVNVSCEDAEKFAEWLTAQERAKGLIESTDHYRLPTDQEWSRMAGISQEEGSQPFERNLHHVKEGHIRYTWGDRWPPQNSTGNFADKAAIQHVVLNRVIEGYEDGYAYTSPVGSFTPNALGIYDLAGNVQEWVSDSYGGPPDFRFLHYGVVRGGSFYSFHPTQVSSFSRTPKPRNTSDDHTGFRLVLEREASSF